MNGHTSDRMIAVSLASVILSAEGEIARRGRDPSTEWFEGRASAAREVAILLHVDGHLDEILTKARAERAAPEKTQ